MERGGEAAHRAPAVDGAAPGAPRWTRGGRWRVLVAGFGVAAFAWNLVGIGTPQPWRDESATWWSTQRSLPDLLSMLGSVDAVHGLYYLALRAWVPVFSDSLFSLRAFSALGVAVGVALVMLVATRMFGPVAALGAGLGYGVLPPLTWAATEARSYAWTAVLSSAMALAFWVALRRNGWGRWAGYAVVVVVAVHGFVYNLLVLAAVLVALPWLPRGRRRRAVLATAAATLACVPFVLLVASQSSQVSWLATYPVTATDVTMGVFWGTTTPAQYGGSVLLVVSLGVAVFSWIRGRDRAAIAYAAGWLLLPVGILVALLPVVQLYHRRYLLICIPALALLLGVLVDRLGRVWLRLAVLAVVVALGVPGYLGSREPDAKLTAAPAADQLAAVARPGDGLYIVDQDVNALAWSFPDQVRGLTDLSAPGDDRWRSHDLFPPSVPVGELGSRLDGVRRVWIWSLPERVDEVVAEFAAEGFHKSQRIRAKDHYRTNLVLLERRD
ncbi:glycosyltransferase family 39 protein [Propionicimonas sp.]|uniref:glycosyltransferase family 39 protein n=1 Tax=Propionicimonas sp. TaxID=1955623 RepID=UPI0039E3405F